MGGGGKDHGFRNDFIFGLEQLYVVAFLSSSFATFFGSAYQAYLPSLVEADHLVEGNSKLQGSNYLSQILGPGLAGFLVQILTAPVAIVVDAVSYLVSAASFLLIRKPEPRMERGQGEASVLNEARDGMAFLLHHQIIGSIMGTVGAANFLLSASTAVMILFMTRQFHLTPGQIGLLFSLAGPTGLVGVILAPRIGRWVGLGPAIILGGMVYGIGNLALPLARGELVEIVMIVGTGQILMGLSSPSYYINWLTIQQGMTPPHLRGRVTATSNFVSGGISPIGALLGGVVGQVIGLRPMLLGVGFGVTVVFGMLALTPVFHLRNLPPGAPCC